MPGKFFKRPAWSSKPEHRIPCETGETGGKKMKLKKAFEEAKKAAKPRKFNQTVELIINLTGINTKVFTLNDAVKLPAGRGKEQNVCIVGTGDFVVAGKKCAEKTLDKNQFDDFKNKKEVRKFIKDVDYFVVEAPVMADFAKAFGQILGPKGKMPLPHHIVPPGGNPCPKAKNLKQTVRVRAKKSAVVQVPIGTEKMGIADLEKNAGAVVDFLVHKLDQGKNNIKDMRVKLTMGPAVIING